MEKSCCFDFDVARSTPGCDRLTCDGKHDPVFNILFDKSTNEYCYCLNRKQLEQYWDCVSKNREAICSKKCSVFDVFNKCMLCRQVADIWYELQKNFFFYPNEKFTADKHLQPIKWHAFTGTNNSKFKIEIAKSVPFDGFPFYRQNSKLYTWINGKWIHHY